MAEKGDFHGHSSADEVQGQVLVQFCQPCVNNRKKTAAAVFCSTCNEFQCMECSNIHNIYTFMKNHKLVDAKAPREERVVYDMAGLDRCEKHEKMVKFFCKDDEKLCCSTCAIIEHRHCKHVEEIQNMDVNECNKNLSLKVKISKIKERSTAAVKHWTDSEQQINEQLENVLQRLTNIRSSVNKKLDDLEVNVKQEATSVSKMKATEYGQNRSKSEETVTILERDLEILDAVKRHGKPEQQFIAQQRVNESLVRTAEKASEEMSKLENIEICLELNQTFECLLDSIEKFGSLKTNISKVTIDSIVEGRPVKLKTIMSIDLQQSKDDTGEPFYSGMDFLPDGRLVAVDNENCKCLIFNERLEQLGSYELPTRPISIVTVSENEAAVTSGQAIHFLRISSFNEITRIRTVKTTSEYYSICMKDSDHFVVGTYNDTKPVRIVSLSGVEEDFNIDFLDKTYAFATSACTFIKSSDKVVVTDSYEHTVFIYYIKTNTSVVVKDDQIKEPMGGAIGPFDSIFVCCEGTNSIVQISQTGQILSFHKLDMWLPYSVTISKDKSKLVVSNNAIGKRKLALLCLDI